MKKALKRILEIIISEIVIAAIFGILLVSALIFLPEDAIRERIIKGVIILWGIAGIGTPIFILINICEILKGSN